MSGLINKYQMKLTIFFCESQVWHAKAVRPRARFDRQAGEAPPDRWDPDQGFGQVTNTQHTNTKTYTQAHTNQIRGIKRL